jgi:hypothetical protein
VKVFATLRDIHLQQKRSLRKEQSAVSTSGLVLPILNAGEAGVY